MPAVVLQVRAEPEPREVCARGAPRGVPLRAEPELRALVRDERGYGRVGRVGGDDGGGRGHERDGEPGLEVPLNVAVEEPRARVVGAEAQRRARPRLHLHGVAAHGVRLPFLQRRVQRRVV